jgi:hypothetical protein
VNDALNSFKLSKLRQGFVDKALAAAVVGSNEMPIASTDLEWDGDAARQRVFELYTDEDGDVYTDGVARAFLYRDSDVDPATMAAYSLGFADVIDGELQIVPRGVAAVAGGRGVRAADIPPEEAAEIEARVCLLYAQIREQDEAWPECPFGAVGDGEDD